MVKRAKQKQNVQSTVYGDSFKMKEVVEFVLHDDDEPEKKEEAKLSFIKQGRRKRGPKAPKMTPKKQNAR